MESMVMLDMRAVQTYYTFMDTKDLGRLKAETPTFGTDREAWKLKYLEEFAQGDSKGFDLYLDDKALIELLTFLGKKDIQVDDIISVTYLNIAGSYREDDLTEQVKSLHPGGTANFELLMDYVADAEGAFVDFPNDFKITLVCKYDEDSVMAMVYGLEESPGICGDCQHDPEVFNDFNCGHGAKDLYIHDCWFAIVENEAIDSLNLAHQTINP